MNETHKLLEPPSGSNIAVDFDADDQPRLSWFIPRTWVRYLPAAFLAVWLCGWGVGEIFALSTLLGVLPNNGLNGGGNAFLAFWLCGWTLGGCAAMYAFYTLVRPTRPELLVFGAEGIYHDPGTPLLTWNRNSQDAWAFWFPPKPKVIRRDTIGDIRLDRVGERQRLAVDCGADRIEIGKSLREPEREWLAEVLRVWAGKVQN